MSFLYRGNISYSFSMTGVEVETAFKCDPCEAYFRCARDLQQHTAAMHDVDEGTTRNTSLRCTECEMTFASKRELNAHRNTHPVLFPTYECENCGKTFTQRSNYQRHLYVHAKVTPYKCEVCQRYFSSNSALNRHSVIHSEVIILGCKM